jgi:CBS domain-containing protein
MKLQEILRNKGTEVYTIWPTATLQDVVDLLVEHNCGSLLVLDKGRLRGIITERDILRAAARIKGPLCDHLVRDHMTEDLLVAQPDDKIPEVMGWMTEHRVRHLPVVQDEQLMGVVSIGDIVKAQHHQLSMENHYLKNYIQS